MKRVCMVCGTANDKSARFCRSCGTPLVLAEEAGTPASLARVSGASRQKTFMRALGWGAGAAVAAGLLLWWTAKAPAPAPPQQIAPPAPAPEPEPAVITPPPLVKPFILPTAPPAVPRRQAAAVEKPQPQGEHAHRHHAIARAPEPVPVPPPPSPVPKPAVPQPVPQSSLASEVAQCKAKFTGITQIFARQRCLWQYCEGHWGQAGCPPKYGEGNDFN